MRPPRRLGKRLAHDGVRRGVAFECVSYARLDDSPDPVVDPLQLGRDRLCERAVIADTEHTSLPVGGPAAVGAESWTSVRQRPASPRILFDHAAGTEPWRPSVPVSVPIPVAPAAAIPYRRRGRDAGETVQTVGEMCPIITSKWRPVLISKPSDPQSVYTVGAVVWLG